jgi:hypothetical protein
MNTISDKDPSYVSSVQLAQEVKAFEDAASTLMPFLKEKDAEKALNFYEINADQRLAKVLEEVYAKVEPAVIHIRPGPQSEQLRKDIILQLTQEHGWTFVDVPRLMREEINRKTPLGLEMGVLDAAGQAVPAAVLLRLLCAVIYNGNNWQKNFILVNFPTKIAQAREFEAGCAKIKTLLYATTADPVVELAGGVATQNVDSLFSKSFRLVTIDKWDHSLFNQKLGEKVEYGVLLGAAAPAKAVLAATMKADMAYQIVDMKAVAEAVRASLSTEEEPFEGEVPIDTVEKQFGDSLMQTWASAKRTKFLFDGFIHKDPAAFVKCLERFGAPSFVLTLKTSEQAWKDAI